MLITLRIPESASLKDKRQVVRSLLQRLRNNFQVAAAEVDDNEAWQVATLGVSCVANTAAHCQEVLSSVRDFVETTRLDAEIVSVESDIFAF